MQAKKGPVTNETPFEYHTNNGYVFKCPRSDFRQPVQVSEMPANIESDHNLHPLMTAVAEMSAYHRQEIWPKLNGFSGYDCIKWVEVQGRLGVRKPQNDLQM